MRSWFTLGRRSGLHVQPLCQMVVALGSLLRHDLPGIKLDEHRPIRLQLLHWYRQPKIIQEEKLQFQMVQFNQR